MIDYLSYLYFQKHRNKQVILLKYDKISYSKINNIYIQILYKTNNQIRRQKVKTVKYFNTG